MFCANCGSKVVKDAVFCGECGTKVSLIASTAPAEIICTDCEKPIPENGTLCPHCGTVNAAVKSDFKELTGIFSGIIAIVTCLAIYAFSGTRGFFWTGLVFAVCTIVGYTWQLINFRTLYVSTKGTPNAVSPLRIVLNVFGAIVFVIAIPLMIWGFFAVSNQFSPEVISVRESHLTQFSTDRTVGEAFDLFFDNVEWNRHRLGNSTFVEVSGMSDHNGERVHARVTFELLGEIFTASSVRINGSLLNNFQVNQFLSDVFSRRTAQEQRMDEMNDLLRNLIRD